MNLRRLFSTTLALALLATAARAQNIVTPNGSLSFTPGDLLVLQTGNGTTTLSGNAAPIFLDDYNPNGTLIQSVAMPTAGATNSSANLLTEGGTAASEGILTLSPNGEYVALAGYSEVVGDAAPSGTASSAVQREAATLSWNGTLTINQLGTTAYGNNNIRSAFTTDGTNIWTAGANSTTGGVWYTNGTTPVQITNGTLGGNKTVNGANGQLYASNGTAILAIGSGFPTAAVGNLGVALPNVIAANIEGFFFADVNSSTPNELYVANNSSNTTAIQKFSLVGGNWTATGNASIGSLGNGTVGAQDLMGVVNGSNVTIYGTTLGSIFDLTDSSGYDGTLSGTAASLVSAGGNINFHGIISVPEEIAAVPEPDEAAALLGGSALVVSLLRRRRPAATAAPAPPVGST
jgi:hypothetical protein